MIDESGQNVYEATASKGVVVTPLADFKKRYKTWSIVELPSRSDWESLARQEIGKRYDFAAIFGIAFRSGWNDGRKWFCSEYVAHCSGLFRSDRLSRITPENLWAVSYNIS